MFKLRRWGIKFDFQRIMYGYIVDFYVPLYRLVIEIDGSGHYTYNVERDKRRDSVFRMHGYEVLRIRNPDLRDFQQQDLYDFIAEQEFVPDDTAKEFFKNYIASLH